ncbi:hypothetical protein HPB48_008831 [Haemaphysalis longicornis]|uniref:Uncharacterized protein n=1 Tax=Haemaphysalis longicornis TaxID=44386 RepID=A0A9J6G7J1_HAELO|nr:hypothetical protein HPB48_008831 [Haemaphysalis longicornis]
MYVRRTRQRPGKEGERREAVGSRGKRGEVKGYGVQPRFFLSFFFLCIAHFPALYFPATEDALVDLHARGVDRRIDVSRIDLFGVRRQDEEGGKVVVTW